MRNVFRLVLIAAMALTLLNMLGRTPKASKKMNVYVESRDWCPACQAYAPVVEQVKNLPEIAAVATFIVVTEGDLPGSPGYIPWTLINPENPKCTANFAGAVSAERLVAAVLKVAECNGL